MKAPRAVLLSATFAALLVGCGGDDGGPQAPAGVSQSRFERQLANAADVSAGDFPAVEGRSLQDLVDSAQVGPQVGLATSVLVPGKNRLAFGLIGSDNAFVYGKSAVYVARSPDGRAAGPYPAPADALVTKPAFRSQTAASEKDIELQLRQRYGDQMEFIHQEVYGRHRGWSLADCRNGSVPADPNLGCRAHEPVRGLGHDEDRMAAWLLKRHLRSVDGGNGASRQNRGCSPSTAPAGSPLGSKARSACGRSRKQSKRRCDSRTSRPIAPQRQS